MPSRNVKFTEDKVLDKMRKLFIFQKKSDPEYLKELKLGFSALSKKSDSIMRIDLDKLSVDYLSRNNIDVVVSNGLPEEWYFILKSLRIVAITVDHLKKYHNLADIVIDFKDAQSNRYFTGKEYSLKVNKDFEIEFDEIANLLKKLSWDSRFWDFPVAFLSCRYLTDSIIYRIDRFVRSSRTRLIEYLCNCHDNRSVKMASGYGFLFTDIRLTFEKDIKEKNQIALDDGLSFALAKKEDIKRLKEIAKNMYIYSRYYFDTNFDRTKVSEFYQGWVEKAVMGRYDDECCCLYKDKRPLGFCTVKYMPSRNTARIGLVGLDSSFQGKGLALKLFYSVFNRLLDKEVHKVFVATQGRNYAAQRLYQRVGFLTRATELWYHKWIW